MATDLLIITPGFPANEQDSTCIPPLQVYLLALLEQRPELRIAVITTQYPATTRTYAWHGINVHPCGGGNALWKKPLVWWRARRTFDRVMQSGAIGAIHSLWLGEAAMLGERFANRCGARHVLTLMGQDARNGSSWWKRLGRKPITVCVSERQAGTFRSMAGSKADVVVPWGIDPGPMWGSDGIRDIDLLFVGSLISVKNPIEFVAVVDDLQRTRNLRAVMIGDGGWMEAVKTNADFDFNTNIEFRGSLPREQVLAAMRRSRVLLHTSTYESQGFVFDEALREGMSIVSRPVGSAVSSDRWRIAEGYRAMAYAVSDLLDHPVGTTSIVQRPVEDTVNAYLRAYGLE